MKKTFTLGAFFFSLIFFVSPVSATTIFSEDFESYSIGDDQSVLMNNSNWFEVSSTGGVSSDWYSSPNQSFNFYRVSGTLTKNFKSSVFNTPVSVGSFFYTINSTGYYKNGGIGFYSDSSNYHSFGIVTPDNAGIIRISDEAYLNTFTYPFYTGVDYHFQFNIDFINDKYSIFINNDLVADNVSFPTLKTFTSINYFQLSVDPSKAVSGAQYYIDDIYLTDGSSPFEPPEVPYLWSNWCGSDAGKLIETTPINLCDVGTSGTVSFDGSKWSWDCIDGVVSQSCRAYLATTEPVDGTCGAWDGETFNTWPPLEGLCELRTSLVVPSMVETINGYTWTCSGINGGTSDYCSGNKTSPPLMPELPAGSLDDCSGLSILEGLICNIGNTLKTIFLPSSEKINELNQTINKMSSKFPFSYISKATETFNDVKGNITETSVLELSIMESEKSSIDFSTIAFFDYIKMLTTILIIIVFSFWLIRFIKHIF